MNTNTPNVCINPLLPPTPTHPKKEKKKPMKLHGKSWLKRYISILN